MSRSMRCPLCNHNSFAPYAEKPRRHIVRCVRCGLVFVNPQPTKQELDTIYNDNYFASKNARIKNSVGYYDYLRERPLLLPYFTKKLAQIPGKRLLEIGCGYGFFLEAAVARGRTCLGIDISRPAVAWARSQGLRARVVDLFDAKFRTGSFDSVVAFHLIEHVTDPVTFLRETCRITKKGGMIFLATPKEGGYLSTIMGTHWLSLRHTEHLYFFSVKTMTAILKKAGYTSIRCVGDETRWYPLHFLFRGATYFVSDPRVKRLFSWLEKATNHGIFARVSLPFPLDTMIVTATKPL